MKGGDPTLASSLGGSRGVPVPLHYSHEQPGSPGSQVTLYGTQGSYSYGKPTTTEGLSRGGVGGGGGGGGGGEYWSNAGTPSPPTFDCVSGYQNVTAISVGDAANIQLYSGGAYSVSSGVATAATAATAVPPSPWSNLSLTGGEEAAFDGTIVADPKECFGCGIPTTAWRRDETGRCYCHNCVYGKMNGVNRPAISRCGKPKQPVAPVNFLLLFLFSLFSLLSSLFPPSLARVASVKLAPGRRKRKEKKKRKKKNGRYLLPRANNRCARLASTLGCCLLWFLRLERSHFRACRRVFALSLSLSLSSTF